MTPIMTPAQRIVEMVEILEFCHEMMVIQEMVMDDPQLAKLSGGLIDP